jgi:hypothetical protein
MKPPPMPPGLETKANAQLEAILPQLQADETAYFAAHGVHWQGLATHSAVPENGADVLPDVGTLAPHDQPAPWPTSYLQTPRTIAVTVDVYESSLGFGYVITATCQTTPPQVPVEAVSLFARVIATGPAPPVATHDWEAVPEPLPPSV